MQIKRFTRHEEFVALEFDGTEESAKEIVEWVKSIVGDQYQRGQMQRGVAMSRLGYDGHEHFRPEAVLHISIDALPESYYINVPAGAYIGYDPLALEVRFKVSTMMTLCLFKQETIHGDIPEG